MIIKFIFMETGRQPTDKPLDGRWLSLFRKWPVLVIVLILLTLKNSMGIQRRCVVVVIVRVLHPNGLYTDRTLIVNIIM